VSFGEILGDTEAFVAAPVHASLGGRTGVGRVVTLPNGQRSPTVPLKPTDSDALPGGFLRDFLRRDWEGVEPARYDPDEIRDAVRRAGVVGLGGAAFPTHVKLQRNSERPLDTLVLNGCECEPYLTADHRLMLEVPEAIVVGLQLAARAAGVERAVIAIGGNKPDAAEALRAAAAGRPGLEIAVCATQYPMGAERQLVWAVLGRTVPSAPQGLPLDVGVLVLNVATAHSIARAVVRGQPLTHRVVTVTGRGVTRPANWLAPIGTPFGALLEASGGLRDDAAKVIAGGPMMGHTVPHLDVPLVKGTGGITVLVRDEVVTHDESACIRCGRCVQACPQHLIPTKIAHAVKARDLDRAASYDLDACFECGCCSYVCPAGIPLTHYIAAGKKQWRRHANGRAV
jgi:electron transport complex protein RnfC